MGKLDGMSAIVTGGGSGIGKAVVERFVEEGAVVAAVDRVPDRVVELQSEHKGKVIGVQADVTRYEDNARAVAEAVRAFGKVDIFVANAGIWDYGARMQDTDPDKLGAAFDEIFAVNVKGYLLGVKAVVDELIKTNGCIIFTLSRAAITPTGGGPLYVASKHAALGLVRNLAFELKPNVRVNGISPGGTATDLRGLAALGESERSFGDMLSRRTTTDGTPAPKRPQPAERAGTYVYLASSDSAYTTGTVIDSDDGTR